MRSRLRDLGLGRVLYYGWHKPAAFCSACVREGGPLEQWRTARGRRAMLRAAPVLPTPGAAGDRAPIEISVLTGRHFWYQTVFCLWTFARQAERTLAPVIYDDGTLTPEYSAPLLRLFPAARVVSAQESISQLDKYLPASRFPALRERWLKYPNLRKLTNVHLGGRGWKLVIDSDLLFFRRPVVLLEWLAHPDRPLHAVDCLESYGYSRPLLESLAGAALPPLVNVGLCGLRSDDLDWEELEAWTAELISRERTHYYLEQALVAMIMARCSMQTVAPAADYVTNPNEAEAINPRAVMHHYVAESKRWYFRNSWRRALAGA